MTDEASTVQGQTDTGVSGGQPAAPATEPAIAAPAVPAAPAASATPAAEQGKTGEAPAVTAPPEYADFGLPELPEGLQYDEQLMGSFKAEAKQLGLSQENATKLANLYAGRMVEQHKAMQEQQQQQVAQWAKDCEADTEIGGIGGRDFKANADLAQQVAAKVATPELMELMRSTGLGNHPEFVRLFVKIGKSIMPDKLTAPSAVGGQGKDAASVLYPNMPRS